MERKRGRDHVVTRPCARPPSTSDTDISMDLPEYILNIFAKRRIYLLFTLIPLVSYSTESKSCLHVIVVGFLNQDVLQPSCLGFPQQKTQATHAHNIIPGQNEIPSDPSSCCPTRLWRGQGIWSKGSCESHVPRSFERSGEWLHHSLSDPHWRRSHYQEILYE